MAIHFIGLCLVTIVLVVDLSSQNQVTTNVLLKIRESASIRQPLGGEEIADIINLNSYGTEYQDIEINRNFSAPGRRISEIKCLEYIWDIIKIERNFSSQDIYDMRIVGGGRPALYGEFSHMGAVGWSSLEDGESKWLFKCGASLISNKFLVTAAHCSQLPKHDRSVYPHVPVVVKLGDKFLKETFSHDCTYMEKLYGCRDSGSREGGISVESQLIGIDKFIKHPEYVSPRHYYDIALIELRESVDFGPLIRPACLWNSHDTSAFENVAVSGWGETSPFAGVISDELQVGDIRIINDIFCDMLLKRKHSRKWRGLLDHQLCAGVLSGRVDTCRGDSGGPLQAKINISLRWPVYHLIGVTSFSYGCMRNNVPGIYVRVASFADWIESIVWPET